MRRQLFVMLCGLVFTCAMCYLAGWIAGSLVHHDPTPEQCLSVCVEEFERYGC